MIDNVNFLFILILVFLFPVWSVKYRKLFCFISIITTKLYSGVYRVITSKMIMFMMIRDRFTNVTDSQNSQSFLLHPLYSFF